MNSKVWGAVILAWGLFGAATAEATPAWVQIPGGATQIAVGASDYPFILDTNGYIQYLAQTKYDCSSGLCVPLPRSWVFGSKQTNDGIRIISPTMRMSKIATDHYGYVWSLDLGGGLWIGHTNADNVTFATEMKSGFAACATSFAPGTMQAIPNEWNHAFGTPTTRFDMSQERSRNYAPFYMTGCQYPSLISANFTWHGKFTGGQIVQWFTSDGWNPLDTGETQVTLFTVDGSATQVPWIVAPMSSGISTAWAYNNGVPKAAPPPKVSGREVSVTYATDHYVVAANHVYRWNGDAYGNRGNPVWIELANSFPPADSTIVQIAYSSALPGTVEGTVGPSNLWMVDSQNRIWQWGDLGAPPK